MPKQCLALIFSNASNKAITIDTTSTMAANIVVVLRYEETKTTDPAVFGTINSPAMLQ